MIDWCFAHPWMTFFMLLVLLSGVRINIASGHWQKEVKLEWRIHELEELLCPCEQHDWQLVETVLEENEKKNTKYICTRCKKVKVAE